MILISAIQALFISFCFYLVYGLGTSDWTRWVLLLEVGAIVFVLLILYEIIVDKIINWFNRDDVFRG